MARTDPLKRVFNKISDVYDSLLLRPTSDTKEKIFDITGNSREGSMAIRTKKVNSNGRSARKTASETKVAKPKTSAKTTTTRTTTSARKTKSVAHKEPTQEEIAYRAWEIWHTKGSSANSEEENWLQAEKELRGK